VGDLIWPRVGIFIGTNRWGYIPRPLGSRETKTKEGGGKREEESKADQTNGDDFRSMQGRSKSDSVPRRKP